MDLKGEPVGTLLRKSRIDAKTIERRPIEYTV